jgi:predicted DNA binding protein
MRELVFALNYEPGTNTLADTLTDYPNAHVRSLSLHATTNSLWRVDHATGSSDALSAIEDAFLTTEYYTDCLAPESCGAESETQVLDRADDMLVLYTYWQRTPVCISIPHLALNYLGEGVLFETRHKQRRYTWRIFHSEGADIHGFLDTLHTKVPAAIEVEIVRFTGLTRPTTTFTATEDLLPPEQREALAAAVEHGYYETPREIDLGELAEKLDVPRSTLTYRVRRAEAHIAKQFINHERDLDTVPPP